MGPPGREGIPGGRTPRDQHRVDESASMRILFGISTR